MFKPLGRKRIEHSDEYAVLSISRNAKLIPTERHGQPPRIIECDDALDEANYANDIDRGMLYLACTRAMHELYLTHVGPRSGLLSFAGEPSRSVLAPAG
ncbi:hypothetical protein HT102_10185 [Hoyosella sp. G463]|uniref:UvrD-like helicase C-terminal domain-containing protein n=1 Tax=Lolliginicoccus lacisalsi TaxID=2742202 RepID=A0A927PMU8_9ACTN|nr:hypothetical protein [Lolliginicoccus lacisalsi]MBD8506856.1 hypothetical protein [Lolliginicoccus lacisalsi]